MDIVETFSLSASEVKWLYDSAFPDEDLVPLVRSLLSGECDALSLAAMLDGQMVGHVVFTHCHVGNQKAPAALLGPLAVLPDNQRSGIGTKLVKNGIHKLKDLDISRVFVLGDPAYYKRFGFVQEMQILPPYTIPKDWNPAWQSIGQAHDTHPAQVKLDVPTPWQQEKLWAP